MPKVCVWYGVLMVNRYSCFQRWYGYALGIITVFLACTAGCSARAHMGNCVPHGTLHPAACVQGDYMTQQGQDGSDQRAQERYERYVYTQIQMGVRARVVIDSPNQAMAKSAAQAVFARLDELESVMSDYRADSELSRLCTQPTGQWVAVSDDLFRVLTIAKSWARQSDGALDFTLGPLTRLWRTARQEGRLPSNAAIQAARDRTGWRSVELRKGPHGSGMVRFRKTGMKLDLGAVGKGWAVDEAYKVLADRGLEHALVELGGDLVLGKCPISSQAKDGQRWRVGIETGYATGQHPVVEAVMVGIATSGDTEQYIEIEGRRYSHLLDPATGIGLTTRTAATVVASTGAAADAAASIVCIVGPERAIAFVRHMEELGEKLGVRMVVDGRVYCFGSLAQVFVQRPLTEETGTDEQQSK